MRMPTLREFTLQLSKMLREEHPEVECMGKVFPTGRPELMTHNVDQINRWMDAGVRLRIKGISFKN